MINQNWCDVLIVGGGFSGMSAAAEFLGKGLGVVLIEKNLVSSQTMLSPATGAGA